MLFWWPRKAVWIRTHFGITISQQIPHVDITVAGSSRAMLARQVSDAEKGDLWPHLLSLYPDFDEYQARTDRNIPVFFV